MVSPNSIKATWSLKYLIVSTTKQINNFLSESLKNCFMATTYQENVLIHHTNFKPIPKVTIYSSLKFKGNLHIYNTTNNFFCKHPKITYTWNDTLIFPHSAYWLIPLCHCKFLIMEPPAVSCIITAKIPQPQWYKGLESQTRTLHKTFDAKFYFTYYVPLANIIF